VKKEPKYRRKEWQEWERVLLYYLYPKNSTALLARLLGRNVGRIHFKANSLGIKKDKEYLADITRKMWIDGKANTQGCFKKGQAPHNKGKSPSEETRQKISKTWFKNGHLPNTTLYDGAISIRPDKRGQKYKFIRLALAQWQELHRYTWEQAHGPIPEGMLIVFKDGDTLNCELENLEMLTREELMRRNSIHRYPEEIVETLRAIGVLQRKINSQTKSNNYGKEQIK
jgi:hypothetical protein